MANVTVHPAIKNINKRERQEYTTISRGSLDEIAAALQPEMQTQSAGWYKLNRWSNMMTVKIHNANKVGRGHQIAEQGSYETSSIQFNIGTENKKKNPETKSGSIVLFVREPIQLS